LQALLLGGGGGGKERGEGKQGPLLHYSAEGPKKIFPIWGRGGEKVGRGKEGQGFKGVCEEGGNSEPSLEGRREGKDGAARKEGMGTAHQLPITVRKKDEYPCSIKKERGGGKAKHSNSRGRVEELKLITVHGSRDVFAGGGGRKNLLFAWKDAYPPGPSKLVGI